MKNLCLVIYLNTDFIRVNVVNVQVSIYSDCCFPSYPDSLLSPSCPLLFTELPNILVISITASLTNTFFDIFQFIPESLKRLSIVSQSSPLTLLPELRPFSTQLKTVLVTSPVTTNSQHTSPCFPSCPTHSLSLSLPSMVFRAKLLTFCYQDLTAQMMVAEYLPSSFLESLLIIR